MCRIRSVAIAILFAALIQAKANYTYVPQVKGRLLTPEEGCGITKVANNKIIGGAPAKPGAWPWMARIGYKTNVGKNFKCGGSLITSRHVLTAAHCIDPALGFVRLGEVYDTKVVNVTEIFQREDINVIKIDKHPNYNQPPWTHDIAILTLAKDIKFTDRIRPICLPLSQSLKDQNFIDTNPFVAGWGAQSEKGDAATILQQLQIPVHENVVCRDIYKSHGKFVSEEQFGSAAICAGIMAGGQDSCKGDSGGPLMMPMHENGKFAFYQIGVIAWGLGCGKENIPGMYARIPYYADWINEKIPAK